MKQNKKYTFERTGDASDSVELHRSNGHRFHILAKLLCLLLAVIFWLFVYAIHDDGSDKSRSPDTLAHFEFCDTVS